LGLGLPNWYLGIGCSGGNCDLAIVFLPGLFVGLLFAGTLTLLTGKITLTDALWQTALPLIVLALLGGASSALVRVPLSFAWHAVEPHWAELVRWGIGGAIFGAAIAVGWRAAPPQASQDQAVAEAARSK
jgi:hypothetical protein